MTDRTTANELQQDRKGEAYRFFHDGVGDVTTAIALALAEIDDRDPLQMDPLHHVVSPDLLEALVDAATAVTGDVMFDYDEYVVTVDSAGGVVIRTAPD